MFQLVNIFDQIRITSPPRGHQFTPQKFIKLLELLGLGQCKYIHPDPNVRNLDVFLRWHVLRLETLQALATMIHLDARSCVRITCPYKKIKHEITTIIYNERNPDTLSEPPDWGASIGRYHESLLQKTANLGFTSKTDKWSLNDDYIQWKESRHTVSTPWLRRVDWERSELGAICWL